MLRIDGVPVGEEIRWTRCPRRWPAPRVAGSIIVILATDAPLLPNQCKRLAQRATVGLARWAASATTAAAISFWPCQPAIAAWTRAGSFASTPVQHFHSNAISALFEAAADATEEAIINALCMATDMTGANGRVSHAIPLDRLQAVMAKYHRLRD